MAGVTGVPVSAHVIALKPGTTYHYRVVASSIEGTTFGADRTFQTPKPMIERLKIKPRRVHRKRGAKVSYIDSESSTTHFVLSRCRKFPKTHCRRYKRVRSFTRHDVAGPNHFHLRVRHLAHGRYRLAATPSFGGAEGATTGSRSRSSCGGVGPGIRPAPQPGRRGPDLGWRQRALAGHGLEPACEPDRPRRSGCATRPCGPANRRRSSPRPPCPGRSRGRRTQPLRRPV